jgi:hypothetical protein
VARVAVGGREVIRLGLPFRPGRTERFWLHTEDGGRRIAHDPRIMNFAVYRCFWSQEGKAFSAEDAEQRKGQPAPALSLRSSASSAVKSPHTNGQTERSSTSKRVQFRAESVAEPAEHDIVPATMGLRFGAGWSVLEHEDGTSYRWVQEGAQFTIQETSDTPVKILSLELEPGPGAAKRPVNDKQLNEKPWQLQILDPNGRILAQDIFVGTPGGRQVAQLMLRVRPERVEHFRFHLESGRSPDVETSDSHHPCPILRIFRCGWSTAGISVSQKDIVSPLPLHTCACGDFTLMAREDWFELLGYPEFEMFSLHIDGAFCYMAHHAGVVEEVLEEPMRIYHIEHGAGSGWTPEGAVKLMERIAAKGIPCLECQEVLAWATEMRRLNRPLVLNHEDWGMPDDVLSETVVGETG